MLIVENINIDLDKAIIENINIEKDSHENISNVIDKPLLATQ